MSAVAGWWHRDVLDAGKLALMLCFVSFVVTFLVTRTITRMIRAGRGPFRDNVTTSGVHVHHAVPGLIALIVGAFIAIDSSSRVWSAVAAVLVGCGVALVLDEFALILHLNDVYWSTEGRLSVDMVSLAAAGLGLALLGVNPIGVADVDHTELAVRLGTSAWLAIDAVLVLTCVLRGKYGLALLGVFIPFVSLVGALRLAAPTSSWARRRYHGELAARAQRRADGHAARWGPVLRWWQNLLGGTPSTK